MTDPSYDYALELRPELAGQEFLNAFGNGNNWCKMGGKVFCTPMSGIGPNPCSG